MCSSLTQTAFCILLLVGTGLAIASLLTPAWRGYSLKQAIHSFEKKDYTLGLITAYCGEGDVKACADAFDKKQVWEKTAIICIVGAIVTCVLALAWTCVMCFACCCKSCLAPPLPVLTGLATIFMGIGVTVYGVMARTDFDITKIPKNLEQVYGGSKFGYSMWLGLASVACLFVDTILGIILTKIYEGYSTAV